MPIRTSVDFAISSFLIPAGIVVFLLLVSKPRGAQIEY